MPRKICLFFFGFGLVFYFHADGKDINRDPIYHISQYDQDTILRGGYKLSYKIEGGMQNIYLKQNHNTIKKIASCSMGLPSKNLGYLIADFKRYFAFAHSFGSGNPNYVELIEKNTGRNILTKNAMFLDVNESMGLILYCSRFIPSAKDRMVLLNVGSSRERNIRFDFVSCL